MKHIFAILATFVFFVGCEQLVAQQTDQRDQLSIETSDVEELVNAAASR